MKNIKEHGPTSAELAKLEKEKILNVWNSQSSKDIFRLFKKDLGYHQILSKKQERKLAKAGKAGRKKLAVHNLPLVINIAKKFRNMGVDFLDLIQEGTLGLFRAAEKFDPKRKYKFSTYAYWWIRQSIISAIFYQSRTIRIPVHAAERLYDLIRTEKLLQKNLERQPREEEIAKKMEAAVEEIRELKALENRSRSISLSTPINNHKSENEDPLENFLSEEEDASLEIKIYRKQLKKIWHIASQALGCDNNGRIFTIVLERDQGNSLAEILNRQGIARLTNPERTLYILARRSVDPPDTLEKLGQDFNLTRERVRQLEAKALRRFRHPKWKKQFEQFL